MNLMEKYGIIIYGIRMFISVGFYGRYLEKREEYCKRSVLGILLYIALLVLLPKNMSYPLSLMLFLVAIAGLAGLIKCLFIIDSSMLIFILLAALATEHASTELGEIICLCTGISPISTFGIALGGLCLAITYGICYWPFISVMRFINKVSMKKKGMIGIAVIVLSVSLLSHSVVDQNMLNIEENYVLMFFYNVYALMTVYLSLIVLFSTNQKESLITEKAIVESLLVEQRERYKFSGDTIKAINLKCHDMKHQISRLRKENDRAKQDISLKELEESILIYDQIAPTYSEALDSIISEKGLYCREHNISLTYMVDGERMEFMDSADIYALMGNAIDNAIEAVENLEDEEKRFIFMRIQEMRGVLQIHVENYCERKVEIQDGFPVTNKKDKSNHGFGVRSMHYIVEKYGGQLSFHQENVIFCLDILIPFSR